MLQAKKAAFCYRAPITKHSSRLIQQVECAIVLPTHSNLQNRVNTHTTALTPPNSQEVGRKPFHHSYSNCPLILTCSSPHIHSAIQLFIAVGETRSIISPLLYY